MDTGVRLEWPFLPPLEWSWASVQAPESLPVKRKGARVLGSPTGHPSKRSITPWWQIHGHSTASYRVSGMSLWRTPAGFVGTETSDR
jgi:hypothetical protein